MKSKCWCGRMVRVRKDGTLWSHRLFRKPWWCPRSGTPVVDETYDD